ncbi:DUF3487 family protein [Hahella ganghwensis]|uniref:DUF3487 family protein n=1 Tax=Hahella ganghwensis TaxID=286420 RepID=UPI000372C59E|nr:DUF3487 family protein [Hahella ganghwensis]
MESITENDEPLANLLDYEQEIFLGATGGEIMTVVVVSGCFWFVFLGILFSTIAYLVGAGIIVMATLPMSIVMLFITTVIALKRLQLAKLNRPEGYFQIVMYLRFQKYLKFLGKANQFEDHVGTWGIERNG